MLKHPIWGVGSCEAIAIYCNGQCLANGYTVWKNMEDCSQILFPSGYNYWIAVNTLSSGFLCGCVANNHGVDHHPMVRISKNSSGVAASRWIWPFGWGSRHQARVLDIFPSRLVRLLDSNPHVRLERFLGEFPRSAMVVGEERTRVHLTNHPYHFRGCYPTLGLTSMCAAEKSRVGCFENARKSNCP